MSSERNDREHEVFDSTDARLRAIAPWVAHPQAIRAIFFDAGFTLLEPTPSVIEIVRLVCLEHGVSISAADLATRMRFAEQRFASGLHVYNSTWSDNTAIEQAYRGFFGELIAPFVHDERERADCLTHILAEFDSHRAWTPYSDVRPTLDALRGRYTLGIISDWSINLGVILRGLNLIDDMHFLVVSATSRRAKPDPHLFETALRRADALGDYTLYIGDTYVQDILGARAVGIHPILIDRERRYDPALIDCPVIHRLDDLLILLGL